MRKILFLLTLVLAACSGSNSDGPVLTFADFNSPPTTPEVVLPPPTTTTTVSPTTTSTSTTLLVVDTPSEVAISSETGYSILEGPGAPRRLLDLPVAAAFEDLQGGFVYQLPGAGIDSEADQRIYWSRSSNPTSQAFLDVTEGGLLRLWGTEEIGGSAQMILTIVDNADDPDQRVERLVVFDFDTGDRVLGEVGSADSGPVTIDYGGGRFVLEQRSGVQSYFEFRNDQGAVIGLASNPQPGCAEEAGCPTRPALDPSGSFLGYVEEMAPGSWNLVIYDLDLGEELERVELPGTLGEIIGLDFDGSTVIVNRTTPDGTHRALVVDATTGGVGEFGLTGHTRFLRVGPGFDGPIEVPAG